MSWWKEKSEAVNKKPERGANIIRALLSKERSDIIQELHMAQLVVGLIQERVVCDIAEPGLDPMAKSLIQLAGNLKKKSVIDRALQIYDDKMKDYE